MDTQPEPARHQAPHGSAAALDAPGHRFACLALVPFYAAPLLLTGGPWLSASEGWQRAHPGLFSFGSDVELLNAIAAGMTAATVAALLFAAVGLPGLSRSLGLRLWTPAAWLLLLTTIATVLTIAYAIVDPPDAGHQAVVLAEVTGRALVAGFSYAWAALAVGALLYWRPLGGRRRAPAPTPSG